MALSVQAPCSEAKLPVCGSFKEASLGVLAAAPTPAPTCHGHDTGASARQAFLWRGFPISSLMVGWEAIRDMHRRGRKGHLGPMGIDDP